MKRVLHVIVVLAMAPLIMGGGGVLGTPIPADFTSTGETFRATVTIDTHSITAATPTGRLGHLSIQSRKSGVNSQIAFQVPADFSFSNFGCTTAQPGPNGVLGDDDDSNLTRQRFIEQTDAQGMSQRVSMDNWVPTDAVILLFQGLGVHVDLTNTDVNSRRIPVITQVFNGRQVQGTGAGVCVNGPEPAGWLLLDAQVDILALGK